MLRQAGWLQQGISPRTLPVSASCRRVRVAWAFLADAVYSLLACCQRCRACRARACLVSISLMRARASSAFLWAEAACAGTGAGG